MNLAAATAALLLAAPPSPPPAPVARVEAASEVHHGVGVPDPYRWLEKAADPEVKAWTRGQDAHTRAVLAAFPQSKGMYARVKEIRSAAYPAWWGLHEEGGTLFAIVFRPPEQQPRLAVLASLDDPRERTIVDPNAIDRSGKTAIDFFEPSHDGTRVAVSLSVNGTEDGTVHVYDVATGKALPDVLPRVNGGTAGGSVAWAADGSGFWYTRYPAPGERPEADLPFFQQVAFHALGTPVAQDEVELGAEFTDPRIAQVVLQASPDGKLATARVARGDGGDFEWFVRRGGAWTRLARFEDRLVDGRFGPDGALWLVSRKDAPRGKVLRLPPGAPAGAAPALVVPEGDGSIEELAVTSSRLYLVEQVGGPTRLRAFGLDGKLVGVLPTPPVSSVGGLERAGAGVAFRVSTFLTPAAWWRADDASGQSARTALVGQSSVSFDDCEVVRDEAVSADGTRVPVTLLMKKGTRPDGQNPLMLYGYGGFNISETPSFSAVRRAWLEQGGIWALANIRGGAEFGEAWHRAGALDRKQNVFEDFAAAARLVVARRWTRPERLVLHGGSNGGLLMGAMITQFPSLARAVVAEVGIFDSLRVELTPNGTHNVTEYGTVQDPAQFHALRAYSPYHRVMDGVPYPSVLLTAGESDPRVDAYHAKKFAARLQAATSSGRPVLLRISGGGHGIGAGLDEGIARVADVYAFAMHELGMTFRPPPRPAVPARK
ncbi:MAG: prolyl oligopeptidase family serine peptidase [Anaeromyxobacteraceae bacterium]